MKFFAVAMAILATTSAIRVDRGDMDSGCYDMYNKCIDDGKMSKDNCNMMSKMCN